MSRRSRKQKVCHSDQETSVLEWVINGFTKNAVTRDENPEKEIEGVLQGLMHLRCSEQILLPLTSIPTRLMQVVRG